MIDLILQTYVVDARTGYDVHVQGPDLMPGRPALAYIAAVNLGQDEADRKAQELLGRPFRCGVTGIAVAHLYAGDRVVAQYKHEAECLACGENRIPAKRVTFGGVEYALCAECVGLQDDSATPRSRGATWQIPEMSHMQGNPED